MGCTPGETLRAAHARLLRLTGVDATPVAAVSADPAPAVGSPDGIPDSIRNSVPTSEAGAGAATLRILTVDDHRTFAELLTGALDREPDLRSVGSASSVESGVQLCRELEPDVVVMDYHLPDGDGLSAAARILEQNPDTRIIMLTGDPSQDVLRQAAASQEYAGSSPRMARWPRCWTLFGTPGQETWWYTPPWWRRSGPRTLPPPLYPPGPPLSPRELDVLRLMSEGHEVRVIANSLGISIHTCRGYVKTIFSKLGSHSQSEAMAEAEVRGILRVKSDVQAF